MAAPILRYPTDQKDRLAFGLEGERGAFPPIGEKADAADRRRRQDGLALRLVVERDVAGDDGELERPARFADALDGAHELPHDRGPLGVAEVEVVCDGERRRANCGEVAPALGHRLLAAL